MNRSLSLLGAFGLGLGAMYFLDPIHGRRRRAVARDKISSAAHRSSSMVRKTREDLENRSRGLIAAAGRLVRTQDAGDPVLEARVHSQLGRILSHPHAIEVHVQDGCATLRGHVLAHELDELLSTVHAIAGIHEVNNLLNVHKHAEHIPALKGGAPPARNRFVLARQNWPPSVRLIAGAAGGAAAAFGLVRGGVGGKLLATAGGALLLRALTNLDGSRLTGIGAGCRAIDLRKTITIQAPLEDVFNCWASFELFPRFMGHVREVRDFGDGRTRWTVAGPAGIPIHWTARVTEFLPYELLAWHTENDSSIAHAGQVRFAATPEGGTRLDIFMSYNPVVGAVGHSLALLLGCDPKHLIDDDLVRFKSLLEQGKATVAHHRITREELTDPFWASTDAQGDPT